VAVLFAEGLQDRLALRWRAAGETAEGLRAKYSATAAEMEPGLLRVLAPMASRAVANAA
jgi:hypothetical protein